MAINKHSLEASGKVKVDGGKIGYRHYIPHKDIHAQKTPIILVHGGPGGSHISMYDSLHALADTRPLIGYDQLGSYLSPVKAIDKDFTRVERFAEEPRYLLDALGVDKAILLGHSWGGVVISEFALNHPDRVAGLIYSAPLISTKQWVDDCNELLKALPAKTQKIIQECEANGTTDSKAYQDADAEFSKRHFARAAKSPDAIKASGRRTNREVYNTMWGPSEFSHSGTLANVDYFPLLGQIKAPTLIICGEYDTATPKTMKKLQSVIAGSELCVVKDAGHAVMNDGNAIYVRTVKDFCKRRIDKPQTGCALTPHP